MTEKSEMPFSNHEQEAEKYSPFSEIVHKKNNNKLDAYLESSRKTYESYHLSAEKIEVADDLSSARFEFNVTENMQSHEGILHGGLIAYFMDSVAGALAWARTETGYQPFTTNMNLDYLELTKVGEKYIIEITANTEETERKETYDALIRDTESDEVTVKATVTFLKKKVEKE